MRGRSITRYRRLEAECDGLIQEVARLMFNGRCAVTKDIGHAGHHLIGRSVKSIRHHPLNIIFVSQPVHDCFHGVRTSTNEYLWKNHGLMNEFHTAADRTYRLLASTRALKDHLDFWNTARFTKPQTVWECDLADQRTFLKQLIKDIS